MPSSIPLTWGAARTLIRSSLLDDDGTRWSDGEVNQAMRSALSQCIGEYTARGGQHFIEEVDVTTDSNGEYDLGGSFDVIRVHGVNLLQGSRYFPLQRFDRDDLRRTDAVARSLKIRLTALPQQPDSDGTSLLLRSSGAFITFPAMDHWVCARAAQQLAIKDDELLRSLEAHDARCRDGVMSQLSQNRARRPPGRRRWWSNWLGYTYEPADGTIALVRRDVRGLY